VFLDAALVVASIAPGALHQRVAIMAGRPVANIRSQVKRIHRSERERLENRRLQSAVRTHFRRLERAVDSGEQSTIADEHRQLVSRIDKAVSNGALHANNGARKKSRAARLLSRASA
jgi:small subunit ribosomal protein S20